MLAKSRAWIKVSSMSEVDREQGGVVPSEVLKREFATLMSLNLQIRGLVSSRDEILDSIREKIVSNGVAPEDRFLATALYSNMIKTHTPEEITQSIELIKGLNRELQAHSGETMAWLDTDVETVSHRLPGPDEVRTAYYLNLGVLPADSQLASYRDAYAIAFEKAVRIEIFNNLDDELTWDMGIGQERGHHFISEPELIPREPIYISAEGKFAPFASKRIEVPLPVIGNEAVAEVLETNKMADCEDILRAAQLLTEAIS